MHFNKVHLRVRYHESAPTQSLCLRSKFENRGRRQSCSGVRRGQTRCESLIVLLNIYYAVIEVTTVDSANMIEPMSASAVNELESWVELNSGVLSGGNEYIKLLGEAQRESRDSSVRHSRASSVKGSPKSPPNSPNLEPSTEDELKGVYINCWRDDSNDWVWEWSSRPDQMPPKDWRFKHPPAVRGPPSATSSIEVLEQLAPAMTQSQSHCLSVRRACLFSRGALAAVLVTNVLSLLVGAGIGVWLSKRGMLPPRLVVLC